MRLACDQTWTRLSSRALLAGSPLRLFRVTEAGAEILRSIEAGQRVNRSSLVDRLLDAGAVHPVPAASGVGSEDRRLDIIVITPQLGGAAAGDGRITVDDGSVPPITGATVRLEVNLGPSAARNAGRRETDAEFILFVDADVDLPAGGIGDGGGAADADDQDAARWWQTLLCHFDDPRVGLVAPRVVGDERSSLDLGPDRARIRAGSRVSYAPGAALLVRTAAFDDVGGFDESLRLGEDVDFVWRLDEAGWRCRYEPDSTVVHHPRATFVEQLRQQSKYGASSGPLALRHPGALAPFRASGWTMALWVAVAVARPLIALPIAAGSMLGRRDAQLLSGRTMAELVLRGHLAGGRQLAAAVRRAWWPLLVPVLWSRRARRLVLASFLLAPRSALRDVAFSVGVWRSAVEARDAGALRPAITRRDR